MKGHSTFEKWQDILGMVKGMEWGDGRSSRSLGPDHHYSDFILKPDRELLKVVECLWCLF